MLSLLCKEDVNISNDNTKTHAFDVFRAMRHEVQKPIYATERYVQTTT